MLFTIIIIIYMCVCSVVSRIFKKGGIFWIFTWIFDIRVYRHPRRHLLKFMLVLFVFSNHKLFRSFTDNTCCIIHVHVHEIPTRVLFFLHKIGTSWRVQWLNLVVALHSPLSYPSLPLSLLTFPLPPQQTLWETSPVAGRVIQCSPIILQRSRAPLPLSPKRGGCLKNRDREDSRNMVAEPHNLRRETLVFVNLLLQ